MRSLKSSIVAATILATSAVAVAAPPSARHGNLTITQAWSRETAPGQAVGGGFMHIANAGKEDLLISGCSPVAAEVQLHSMTMQDGVMRMRQLTSGIAVPANGSLDLKPGSFHIMFIGLKQPLEQGDSFPVTLTFQRAGNVTVQLSVQPVGATGPMDMHHGKH